MGLMINDVDLKTTYKFVTTDVNGRGAPPVERSTLEDLSFDGAIELGTKLGKRDISITGYVYGTSPNDARTNKDNLISFVSQAYTDEVKITFPDTSRSIYAKLAGTPIVWQAQGPTLNAVAYSVTMNFVALDPYFYGTDISPMLGTGMVKLSTEAPLYLVDPRRTLYKREPKMKVYPVTVVNLLGKYGDFETDSNGDGLADGWSRYGAASYSIVNFKQRGSVTGTIDGSEIIYDISIPQQTHRYFFAINFSGVSYHTSGIGIYILFIDFVGGTPQYIGKPFNMQSGKMYSEQRSEQRYYYTFTNNGTNNILKVFPIVFVNNTYTSESYAIVDNAIAVDLTRMGVLPPPLKEYFNNVPSTWADLATTSNITAIDGKVQSGDAWLNDLLPYVNGVGTLGYAWGA